ALDRRQPKDAAVKAERILAEYLRHRFDLTAAEPTPAEVADRLRCGGASAATAEKTAAFFRGCDAVRFTPNGTPSAADWPDTAAQLILALEAEPCSSSAS